MESHLRINRQSAIMFVLAFHPAPRTQEGCNLLTLRALSGYLGHQICPFENQLKKELDKISRS